MDVKIGAQNTGDLLYRPMASDTDGSLLFRQHVLSHWSNTTPLPGRPTH